MLAMAISVSSCDANEEVAHHVARPAGDDSLAIIRAVAEKGGRGEWITLVGDTAWVVGSTSHTREGPTDTVGRTVSHTTMTWFDHWEARVERRGGQWVHVSRRRL